MKRIRLAGCVLLDEEGRILLMHRSTPTHVQWEIPGGKIEEGEDPVETAKREIQEELGVDVSIVKKLGEQSFDQDGYTMDYVWFLATAAHGTPTLKEAKFDALQYFDWEELRNKSDLSANTKNLVAAYFNSHLSLK